MLRGGCAHYITTTTTYQRETIIYCVYIYILFCQHIKPLVYISYICLVERRATSIFCYLNKYY